MAASPSIEGLSAHDRKLAQAAITKEQHGHKPTREEARALKRVRAADEENKRWHYYRTIPKKHWATMSGRQQKVLNEQAKRYGVPLARATIDLTEVATWLHDFLSTHARRLLAPAEGDELLASGSDSPALEEYRKAKAALANLDLATRRREMLSADDVRMICETYGGHIKRATRTLKRRYGAAAGEIITDALQAAADDLDRSLEHD